MSGGLLSSPLPWPYKNKRIAVPAAFSMLEKMTKKISKDIHTAGRVELLKTGYEDHKRVVSNSSALSEHSSAFPPTDTLLSTPPCQSHDIAAYSPPHLATPCREIVRLPTGRIHIQHFHSLSYGVMETKKLF